MAIQYNKNITKDRRIFASGPRDQQLKQQKLLYDDKDTIINELRSQLTSLKLNTNTVSENTFTAEQVNLEILNAVKEETSNLNKKHLEEKRLLLLDVEKYKNKIIDLELKVKLLEKDVASLNDKIVDKDKIISEFKSKKPENDNNVTSLLLEATKKIDALSNSLSTTSESSTVVASNRPQMTPVFVDPIEKESKIQGTIDVVEDISTTKKEELNTKVDKLKSLLGKLPSKR